MHLTPMVEAMAHTHARYGIGAISFFLIIAGLSIWARLRWPACPLTGHASSFLAHSNLTLYPTFGPPRGTCGDAIGCPLSEGGRDIPRLGSHIRDRFIARDSYT